jgi:hypothetical protein
MKRYKIAEFKGWKKALKLKYNTLSSKKLQKIISGQIKGDRKAAISVLSSRKLVKDQGNYFRNNYSSGIFNQQDLKRYVKEGLGDVLGRELVVKGARNYRQILNEQRGFQQKYTENLGYKVVPDKNNYTEIRRALTPGEVLNQPYNNQIIPQSETGYLGYLSPNASPEAYNKSKFKGMMEEEVPILYKPTKNIVLNRDGLQRLDTLRNKYNR